MTVEVRIPSTLRRLTGNRARISAPSGSVRDVLAALEAAYPGLLERTVDGNGALHTYVNIFVNDTNVRAAEGLETRANPGCTVSIVPAVAGG